MINKTIRDALLPFGFPVEFEIYNGESDTYFTFQYSTMPDEFSDDTPNSERYIVQVHFFCPLTVDNLATVQGVKETLFGAGFQYPDTATGTDEDCRHVIFDTEFLEVLSG